MRSTEATTSTMTAQHARLRITTALGRTLVPFLLIPTASYAAPEGGIVAHGIADIAQSGNLTTITQGTDRAVLDWQKFNLSKDESARFIQPNANSVAVNRIHDVNPSEINGSLTANGTVMLVNPNGVFFGSDAKVDVGGLIASTASPTDLDAKNWAEGKRNDLPLSVAGKAGAQVLNAGTITAKEAGLVGLVAPKVENSGIIRATKGRVQLASGDTATLDLYGDGLVSLAVDKSTSQQLIHQRGMIEADGGTVLLTAAAGQTVAEGVIKMDGVIQAHSIDGTQGKIILSAAGANGTGKSGNSQVSVTGKLDVSGKTANAKGGSITVTGDKVTLASTAKLKASGAKAGGEIKVGGDYQGKGSLQNARTVSVEKGAVIEASATDSGNGGRVILWSDDSTNFAGDIIARGGLLSGNGGFVETSGKQNLISTGNVDLRALNGSLGTWLLDPTNITIYKRSQPGTDNNNSFTTAYLEGQSTGANIVLTADNDITLDLQGDVLTLAANANITLTATNGQIISASDGSIIASGTGAATLIAGTDINFAHDVDLTTASGAVTLRAGGNILYSGSGDITTAAGAITLNSDRDATNGGVIYLGAGTELRSNGGAITLGGGANPLTDYAIGNSATYASGIYLSNAILNAGGGNISMRGQGWALGTSTASPTEESNGIVLTNGTTIETSLNGSITLDGIGSGAASRGFGVYLWSGTNTIIAQNGDINIRGTGKGRQAVALSSSGINKVQATGSGNITVIGHTSATNANIVSNSVAGGFITNSGNITLNSAANIDSTTASSSLFASSISGTISLIANTLNLDANSRLQTGGNLIIRPYTAGTTVGVGTGAGALNISDALLANITAGSLWLGGYGTSASDVGYVNNAGNLTINLNRSFANNINLLSASNILTAGTGTITTTGSGNIFMFGANIGLSGLKLNASGTGSVTERANGIITHTSGSNVTTNGGKITLNADRDANGSGAISLTSSNLTSNGGAIILGGGLDPLLSNAVGVSGYEAGINLFTSVINAGGGAISIRGQGYATASVIASGININNSSVTTTGTGTITMVGKGGGTGATNGHGIYLISDSTINAQNGDINLTGTGGDGATSSQSHGIAISVTGTNSINASGAGNISLTGTGGSGSGGTNQGIIFNSVGGGVFSNSGNITLTATTGGGTNSFGMVGLTSAIIGGNNASGRITLISDSINTAAIGVIKTSGDIVIRPLTAGTSVGIGSTSSTLRISDTFLDYLFAGGNVWLGGYGLDPLATGYVNNAGTLTINTTRTTSNKYNFLSAGNIVSGGDSTITFSGAAGTNLFALGDILISNDLDFVTTGTGNVTLMANGSIAYTGSGDITTAGGKITLNADRDGNSNGAIYLGSSTALASNGGAITLGGGADPLLGNAFGNATYASGVTLDGANLNAGGGDLTLRGTGYIAGANNDIYTNAHHGVFVTNSTSMQTTGAGKITVTGQGGGTTAGGRGSGVYLYNGAVIAAQNGDINIVGTGGGSTGTSGNDGFGLSGIGANRVQASGSGNINITGTGGTAAGSSANSGININSNISGQFRGIISGSGNVTLTGIANGTSSYAINTSTNTNLIGGSAATGTITLIGNNFNFPVNPTIQTTGDVVIRPYTAGTTISVGTHTGNTLQLTKAFLESIVYGNTLWIGGYGLNITDPGYTSASSTINISGALTFAKNIVFTNSAAIAASSGSITTTAGNITFRTSGNSNLDFTSFALSAGGSGTINTLIRNTITSTSSTFTTQGGAITFNADSDDDSYGAVRLTGSTVTSNGGAIILGGGLTPLTDYAGSGTTSGAGVLISNTVLDARGTSAGGNITVNGQGYQTSACATIGSCTGITVDSSSRLQTSHNGTIALNGLAGGNISGGTNAHGIYINGASTQLITANGNINLTGDVNATDASNRDIYINGGSLTSTAGSILFNSLGGSGKAAGGFSIGGATISTGSGNITLNDDAVLNAAQTFNAGTGTVTTKAISAGSYGLTLTANDVAIGGNLSGTGTLTLQPGTTSRVVRVNYGTGDFNLDTTELGYLVDGWSLINIGRTDNTLDMMIGAATWNDPVAFRNGYRMSLYAFTGQGNASLTSAGVNGWINILGDIVTSGGNVSFGNASGAAGGNITTNGGSITTSLLSMQTSMTINSGGGAIAINNLSDSGSANNTGNLISLNSGSGNISLGPVTSTTDLTLNGNAITLTGALGTAAKNLGNVSITSNNTDITLPAILSTKNVVVNAGTANITTSTIGTGAGNLSLYSDSIALGGNLTGTGNLLLQPNSTNRLVRIVNGASDYSLTTTELGYLKDGWNSITIGNAANTGMLLVGSSTWYDPITFVNNGQLEVSGNIVGSGNASLTFNANSGQLTTNDTLTITTAGQNVSFTTSSAYGYTKDISITTNGGNITYNLGGASGLYLANTSGTTTDTTLTLNAGTGTITLPKLTNGNATYVPNFVINGGTITGGSNWFGSANIGNVSLTSINSINMSGTLTTAAGKTVNMTVTGAGNSITTNGGIYTGTGGSINLTADDLILGGTLAGTGTLTIQPYTNSRQMAINSTTFHTGTVGLMLSTAETALIQNGWSQLVFGKNTGTGAMMIGSGTWYDPVKFINNTRIHTYTGSTVTGSDNASITFDNAAAGWLNLDGNIVTNGNDVTIGALVNPGGITTNGGNVSIGLIKGSSATRVLDIVTSGGTITLGSINSAGQTITKNLRLNSGTGTLNFTGTVDGLYNIIANAGSMSFNGAWGASTALAGASLTSASNLTLPAITSTGNVDISAGTKTITAGAISTGTGDLTLTANDMTLNGNLTGTGIVTLQQGDTSTIMCVDATSCGALSLDISAAELARLVNGWTAINLGRTDGYVLRVATAGSTTTFNDPVVFRGVNSKGFFGNVTGTNETSFNANGSGWVDVYGTITTAGQAVNFGGTGYLYTNGTATINTNGGAITLSSFSPGSGATLNLNSGNGAITIQNNFGNANTNTFGNINAGSGTVTFGSHVNGLNLTASAGNFVFNGLLGPSTALAGLSLTSANTNITLPTVLSTGNVSINAGTGTITAGAITTSAGDLTLTADDLVLNGDLTGSAGKTLTMQTSSLNRVVRVDQGSGDFNISAAELTRLKNGWGTIAIGRTDNTTRMYIGSIGGTTTNFSDNVIFRNSSAGKNVHNVTATDGASISFINSADLNGIITTNGGSVSVTGTTYGAGGYVNSNGGEVNLGSLRTYGTSSGLTVNSANGNINITGVIQADMDIYGPAVRNFNLNAASGTIAFGNTVNTPANITANAGAFTFNGAWGANTALGNVSLTSANTNITLPAITSTGNVDINAGTATITAAAISTGAGNLTLTSDDVTLNGDLVGTGDITLQTYTVGRHIRIANGAGDYNLDTNEIARIKNGWANILIGRDDGTGNMYLGTSTWYDPLTLRNGTTGASKILSGTITGLDNAGFTIGKRTITSAITLNNAAISTVNGKIELQGNVTSTSSSLETQNSDIFIQNQLYMQNGGTGLDIKSHGGLITFNHHVNGPTVAGQLLNVDAGTGQIKFNSGAMVNGIFNVTMNAGSFDFTNGGNWGNNTALSSISLTSGSSLTLPASMTSSGNLAITVTAPTTGIINANALTSTGGNMTLTADDLNLAGNITGSNAGALTLQPYSAARGMSVNSAVTGNLDISSAEIARLQNGWGMINLGRTDASVYYYIGNGSGTTGFTDNLTLRHGNIAGAGWQLTNLAMTDGASFLSTGKIDFNGQLSTDGGNVTVQSVLYGYANANITTNGGNVSLNQLSTFNNGNGATINTTNGSNPAGNITIGSITRAGTTALSDPRSFTLNAGTTGTITITGTVNTNAAITANAGTLTFGGTWGGTTTLGDVALTAENSVTLPAIKAASLSVKTNGTNANIATASALTTTNGLQLDAAQDILLTNGYALNGGTGAVKLLAKRHIDTSGGGSISSTGGTITLNSDSDATNGGAIRLLGTAMVTSNGGAIIFGGGTDPLTGYAKGTDATYNSGITIGAGTLNAGGGNITMHGSGWNDNSCSNNCYGIFTTGSTIQTTGNGRIILDGIGGGIAGGSSSQSHGLQLVTTNLTTQNGDISITGLSTETVNSTSSISIANTRIRTTGTGDINLTATDIGNKGGMKAWTSGSGSEITSGGTITYIGNRFNTGSFDATMNAAKDIIIRPYTAGTTVGIGSGTGGLVITDAMLGGMSYGQNLWIGGYGNVGDTGYVSNAGSMTINSVFAFDNPAHFLSGGTINLLNGANLSNSGSLDFVANNINYELNGTLALKAGANFNMTSLTSNITNGTGGTIQTSRSGGVGGDITFTSANRIYSANTILNTTGDIRMNAQNDITLSKQNANSIIISTTGAGSSITVNSVLTASGTGNALILDADTYSGVTDTRLKATGGRWLVYGSTVASSNLNSLTTNFKRYSCAFGGSCPTMPATGNGVLYTETPTLIATPNTQNIIYGNNAILNGYGYSLSGYYTGDASADSITGSLNGSSTYIAGADVNDYGLNYLSGSLASAMGYSITYANNATAIHVTPRTLTLSLSGLASKVYDGLTNADINALTLLLGNKFGTDDVTLNLASALAAYADKNAATTKNITVSGLGLSGTKAGNYQLSSTSITGAVGRITPASLNVIANSYTKTYGDAAVGLGYSYSGLVGGDTAASFTGGLTRTNSMDAGSYAITQGSLAATGNYTIGNYTAGTYLINKAILNISGPNLTRMYGDTNTPLTWADLTISGLKNGEDGSVLDVLGISYGAGATVFANAGTVHSIGLSAFADNNYSLGSYTAGSLAITKAPIVISPNSTGTVTGQPFPVFTANITGFRNGDSAAVINGLKLFTDATLASPVGQYGLYGTGATATNYYFVYNPATFTVMPGTALVPTTVEQSLISNNIGRTERAIEGPTILISTPIPAAKTSQPQSGSSSSENGNSGNNGNNGGNELMSRENIEAVPEGTFHQGNGLVRYTQELIRLLSI